MTSNVYEFTTTYAYEPLKSHRHIRLLEVSVCDTNGTHDLPETSYSLVQVELPLNNDAQLEFEALSYTWGIPERVSGLQIDNEAGIIGLTANLTEAMPHIIKHSRTKRIWIDQLSIHQGDDTEKSVQVGLMSEIYKKATRVIIWLGPEDENSRISKQWLEAVDKLIPTLASANKIAIGSPEYNASWRQIILRDTFSSPGTDAKWLPAIGRFWGRPWFRRGWVVQESLLAQELLCLTSDIDFSLQDLEDLFTMPADDTAALLDYNDGWISYRIIMQLKTDPFTTTPQPLRFLRLMAAVAGEFETQELCDRLYGFLGLIEGLDFVPDYQTSAKEDFTRFAATIAKQYGSLDFLSMWAANLDELVVGTPQEFLGFPSWVPSFTTLPLTAPFRLAVGGSRSWGTEVKWNAAAGRHHIHDQSFDAAITKRLQVRGQIIDHIGAVSSTRIAKYFDIDDAYLHSLVDQIKKDLTGFNHWDHVDVIQFLNVVSCNGVTPRETAEQILDLAPSALSAEHVHLAAHKESLGSCLVMGRGRRFTRTEEGRAGLVPWIGSRAKAGDEKGSAIVVLHGCIVPMVLQRVDGGEDEAGPGEWKVVGDCYVEGVMFGEEVTWDEDAARTFVLV